METYYSIGEVAKLTNISIQTLRYYDRIQLFKPSYVDPKTNYRYYCDSQLYYLDLIKSLKFLGTSLEDIQRAQNFTPEELLTFLEQQETVVETKVQKLLEVQHSLLKIKKQMQEQLAIPIYEQPYEKLEDEKRILTISSPNLTPKHIPSSYYSSLQKTVETQGSAMNNRYGCIYKLRDYATIDDMHYDAVFTPLITDRYLTIKQPDMDVRTLEPRRYICIAFRFTPEKYFNQYRLLYETIQQRQLLVIPTVYEIFMQTNYSQKREDEFIVELQVPLL